MVRRNQRPISTASWGLVGKMVGRSSSLITIATAVRGISISIQVVSRRGPVRGSRAMK